MPFYIRVTSLINLVHCITQTEEPKFFVGTGCGVWGVGKWGSGEVGKWGSGNWGVGCGVWGVGEWEVGSGEVEHLAEISLNP